MITDVAIRRIAWDWNSTKRMAASAADYVRSFTTTRQVETRQSLDALKRVREEVTDAKLKGDATKPPAPPAVSRPDPRAKFEAPKGVEGDITQIVGGASNKPVPPPPKKVEPKGGPGGEGSMSSLMAAKRRAQEKIREKEQGEGQ
jgi:hypothetical protein